MRHNMSDKNALLGWPKKNDTDRRIQVDGFARDPDDPTGFRLIDISTSWWYDVPVDHDIEISIDGKMIYKTVRVRDIEWDSKIE